MPRQDRVPYNIKFICEKCGKSPIKDNEKSNNNWDVFPTTCKCGGKIKMQFE